MIRARSAQGRSEPVCSRCRDWILLLVLGTCRRQLADVLGVLGAVGDRGAVALHGGAAGRHVGVLLHRLPLDGVMAGVSRVVAGGVGSMAGRPGFMAGGFMAVARPAGAHLSGLLAKLSGARDQRGERSLRFTSYIPSPFFLK